MIDYVLVNKCFHTSVLDTRVYRSTLHESDHELAVSSLQFKIKVKQRQTGKIRYQTTNISSTCRAGYPSALAKVLSEFTQSSSAHTLWDTVKSSIHKACEFLPLSWIKQSGLDH